jgi:hypothetical protein
MAYPPAPLIAPFSGSLDQRLSMLAEAMSRKANMSDEPVYAAVMLIAPNGSTWRLSVSNTGALSTTAVPRT